MDTRLALQRPTSARGAPLSLPERVALYSRQASAANNAAVLRNVAKPTADEMATFVEQMKCDGKSLFDHPGLLRILLTDSDYDGVCRTVLNLEEAVIWHENRDHHSVTPASTLELLLQSTHVFSDAEIQAAHFATQSLAGSSDAECSVSVRSEDPVTVATGQSESKSNVGLPNDHVADRGVDSKITHHGASEPVMRSPIDSDATANEAVSRRVDPTVRQREDIMRSDSLSEQSSDRKEIANKEALWMGESNQNDTEPQYCPNASLHDNSTNMVSPTEKETSTDLRQTIGSNVNSIFAQCSAADASEERRRCNQVVTVVDTVEGEPLRETQELCELPVLQPCSHQDHRAHDLSYSANVPGDQPVEPGATLEADVELLVRTLDRRIFDDLDGDLDEPVIAEDASILRQAEGISLPELIRTEEFFVVDPACRGQVTDSLTRAQSTRGPVNEGGVTENRTAAQMLQGRDTVDGYFAGVSNEAKHGGGDVEGRPNESLISYPTFAEDNLLEPAIIRRYSEEFQVGDMVKVRYRGLGRYLSGEIAGVLGDGLYNVRYADGEYESGVVEERIRVSHVDIPGAMVSDRIPDEESGQFLKQDHSERLKLQAPTEYSASQPQPKGTKDCEEQRPGKFAEDNLQETSGETPGVLLGDIGPSESLSRGTTATHTHESSLIQDAQNLLDEVCGEENEVTTLFVTDEYTTSDGHSEDEENELEVDRILETSARLTVATKKKPYDKAISEKSDILFSNPKVRFSQARTQHRSVEKPVKVNPSVDIPPNTLRYLTRPARSANLKLAGRPKTSSQVSTPRNGTATPRRKAPKPENLLVSWKEVEEWKNVDLILNRKRRVVTNGQVEGSDVPWGEEFAAIQSLKRFSAQYPEILREHIENKLREVVNADTNCGSARFTTTKVTSAARDALLLVKDLAFLLRHRLGPFLDSILPVVLPAVFHSQRRFLCDTAYEVLEALVAHCSSRRLVAALVNQALKFPRDDMRLVNLSCLYVEKCLTSLSVASIQELMTRSTSTTLEAIAELLTCKSAACQNSLQKSLLIIQLAVGDNAMEQILEDHLIGNSLALVRKHLDLAENAVRSVAKSPSPSPKKLQQSNGEVPLKMAAASLTGGVSILQRMLMQRQNRVVPAPE